MDREERIMAEATQARFRAAIVALAPAVLLAGLGFHPYIAAPTDPTAVAAAAAADPTRWALAHLAIGVGYGLTALAFVAIRSALRAAGEDRWSGLALPFGVMGSTLFAILPGMEFAPLAAAQAGGDGPTAQAALLPWFVPVLLAGGLSFALGALGFALAIPRSGVMHPPLTWLVVGALVVLAAARFIPLGAGQYVIAAAGMLALWPLAFAMWRQPATHSPSRPRSMAA
jgi:hypothetical protein